MSFYDDVKQLPDVVEPTSFYVNGEFEIVHDTSAFALMVDKYMGRDAAEYLVEALTNAEFNERLCPGECTHTYELQEGYDNIIRDARDDLKRAVAKYRRKSSSPADLLECVERVIESLTDAI